MTCQAVKGKIRWSRRLKLRMRAVKGLCLPKMEGGDILCECMICSRARCSTWQAPWVEGSSASCLPSYRTCSHLLVECWKQGENQQNSFAPQSHHCNCCPKQIDPWNCSLPNIAFVYADTISARTGQIRKNYGPTSIPGEAFCIYLFPSIMHDNSRIHSSKAPAVIPWKELYLTWIGHSIFQQALLRIWAWRIMTFLTQVWALFMLKIWSLVLRERE